MAGARISQPKTSILGPILWAVLWAGVFVVLSLTDRPQGAVLAELKGAGPDGVTAYFATPEAAAAKSAQLIEAHDWIHLARYYDIAGSSVTPAALKSGAFFKGLPAADSSGAVPQPFPPGYRFLYSESAGSSGLVRVVVVDAPANTADVEGAPKASFYLRAEPEGYRILPADAAAHAIMRPSR